MGGAQRILHGVLEQTKGLVAGVTCGAGMPYKLSEITASYGVSYSADHQLGAGFFGLVEAGLFQSGGMAVGGGV